MRSLLNRGPAAALGALTGLVGLIAMIRLIAGAGFTSVFAWAFLLAAMLPWIGYCIWRARHGRISARAGLAILALDAVALIGVWLFTLGPVLALAATLLAFVIIWVHDWPQLRPAREDRYVRVEELTQPDDEDDLRLDTVFASDRAAVPHGSQPEPGLTTETPRNAA